VVDELLEEPVGDREDALAAEFVSRPLGQGVRVVKLLRERECGIKCLIVGLVDEVEPGARVGRVSFEVIEREAADGNSEATADLDRLPWQLGVLVPKLGLREVAPERQVEDLAAARAECLAGIVRPAELI
jgi:hypothetical protein